MGIFAASFSALIFLMLEPNIVCLTRDFIKDFNAGFRLKEGINVPVESLIDCATLCRVQKCSNFYYKNEDSLCNLETSYAVSPISDPQDSWSYYVEPVKGPNVAFGMDVTHMSQWAAVGDYGPHFAVDGVFPHEPYGYFCSHTAYEQQPWLKIDLGNTKRIDRVVMYNRQDENGERLQYFWIDVIKNSEPALCGSFNYQSKTAETVHVMCTTKPEGSEIKITIATNSYLVLCEVEVFEWIYNF